MQCMVSKDLCDVDAEKENISCGNTTSQDCFVRVCVRKWSVQLCSFNVKGRLVVNMDILTKAGCGCSPFRFLNTKQLGE